MAIRCRLPTPSTGTLNLNRRTQAFTERPSEYPLLHGAWPPSEEFAWIHRIHEVDPACELACLSVPECTTAHTRQVPIAQPKATYNAVKTANLFSNLPIYLYHTGQFARLSILVRHEPFFVLLPSPGGAHSGCVRRRSGTPSSPQQTPPATEGSVSQAVPILHDQPVVGELLATERIPDVRASSPPVHHLR